MSDQASGTAKPVDGAAASSADAPPTVEVTPAAEAAPAADAQIDGTVEELGGSGLQEPDWDVEVSLSDLQNNEATPFHSATTWDDLNL